MVSLTKRKRKGKTEYYLKYASTGKSKEKYVGITRPQNLDALKKQFEEQAYREDKVPSLEIIKKNYSNRNKTVDPKILENQHHGFKINHTYSTQKIEGSTMTLGQTRNLLELGLSPKDTLTKDIVEAEQLSKIFEAMLTTLKDIDQKLILSWHDMLFQKTDVSNAGSFRRSDVGPMLGKTKYDMWDEIPDKISELITWYRKEKKKINPVELSARFHKRFELIHPFIDGNGRIGRLLMIFILYKNGYPMLDVRPREKLTYINKLESSHLKKNEMIFVKWFISKYLRDNKKYL